MEISGNIANSSIASYGGHQTDEAALSDQKMVSHPLEMNSDLHLRVNDDLVRPKNASSAHDMPILLGNSLAQMGSSNLHDLLKVNAAPSLDIIIPNSKSLATDQNEVRNILMNLDLPRDLMVHSSNKTDNNVNHNQGESLRVNLKDSHVGNFKETAQRSIFDVDKGYTSDNTDLSQIKSRNSSQQNGAAVKDTNTIENGIQNLNMQNRLLVESKTASKNSQKLLKESQKQDVNLKQAKKNITNSELNHDTSNLPSSRLAHRSESEKKHSGHTATKHRVRTISQPGNSKLAESKHKAGGLSDDEYIINNSQAHYGRRSAPIFAKRIFSASEFWNSGQTAIGRSRLQDVATAHERQKAKSPITNVISRHHEGRISRTPRLQRPHSVDPDSFLNEVNNDHIKKPAKSSVHGKDRRRAVNYGSTDDARKGVEYRGYVSENEAGDLRRPSIQKSSGKGGFNPSENLVWNINEGDNTEQYDDIAFENPGQNSTRTRGMKGVFRIPYSVSPHVIQTKVTQGPDGVDYSNEPYGYITEKDSIEFQKQSVLQSSDDDTIDEDSNESAEEKVALEKSSEDLYKLEIKSEVQTEVYKRRWYLLFLFSITAMLWNAIWSTWGPIAQSAKAVYDWSDGDIAMFTYLGNIPFLVTMFPCAYLMDVSGMRLAMIFSCGFMFLGSGFRCIPGDKVASTWLIRTGQLLNGMAGTIPSSGPALLSGLWFPPNQRATATAISTVAGYMGASLSFIIGPMLVPEPGGLSPVNGTDTDSFFGEEDYPSNGSIPNATNYYSQEQGIMTILYGEFALAGLLLLMVLVYFPSKPPLPPSISASMPREKYLNGLKLLIRNKQFWICAVAFSIPIGVYESWQVILDINLDSKGISQQTAGWLDFYAVVGGCVSGLLVSRFADLFIRQMKLFLLVFYAFSTLAVLWFTLVLLDIIPFDTVSIYASIILTGVFLDGGSPLFFELTIEVSYPVGEGVTSGFTHMMCAAAGTIFLIVVQIQNIGTDWMNWCFLGCVALTIPLLMFINTSYARADIDDTDSDVSDDEEQSTSISGSDVNEKSALLKNSSV